VPTYLRQAGAAGGGRVDQSCDGRKVGRPASLRKDFDRSGDDGQDVVEVMDDAASKLANDLHPLHLAKLRFRVCRQGRLRHFLCFPAPAVPFVRQSGGLPQLNDA
jgi:hypothetical protein